jgi:hypothetical protein
MIYVQTTGTQQVSVVFNPVAIPGLTLTLPQGAGENALVILNAPNVLVAGSVAYTNGGQFFISVNGAISPTVASVSYYTPSMGGDPRQRASATLVLPVPLTNQPQAVVGLWQTIGPVTLVLDTPASLSATFG